MSSHRLLTAKRAIHRRGDGSQSPTLQSTSGAVGSGGSVFSRSHATPSVHNVEFAAPSDDESDTFSHVAREHTEPRAELVPPNRVPPNQVPPAEAQTRATPSPPTRQPAPYEVLPTQTASPRGPSTQPPPTQPPPAQVPPYLMRQPPPTQSPPYGAPPAQVPHYQVPPYGAPPAQVPPYGAPPAQVPPYHPPPAHSPQYQPPPRAKAAPPAQAPAPAKAAPPTQADPLHVPPVEEIFLDGNEELRSFFEDLVDKTAVQKYVKLPWVVVVGATSSGKSMLLSHLANIELPSAHELTTCVPIEIHMHRTTNERKASVSVELLEDKRDTVAPFEVQEVDERRWDSIPSLILGAQQFILNIRRTRVARDRVVVNIWDKSVEDLTLVDLPGTVQTTLKKDPPTLIKDIRDMLDEYLSNPNSIIVTVLPASEEIHNSGILEDARKADPTSRRTLPVITKPDRIQAGTEKEALELLSGRKTREYCNGFHMVMGRAQQDLDNHVTIEEGIENEAAFFSREPWRNVRDRKQFGIQNLRVKLGRLQLDKFRASIPGIIHVVRTQKAALESELGALGDGFNEPGDRRVLWCEFCNQLADHLHKLLMGYELLHREDRTVSSNMHQFCTELKILVAKGKLANFSPADIPWIKGKIERLRTPPLPLFPDMGLFHHIVRDCIRSDFATPCKDFVSSVSDALEDAVIQALNHTWKHYLEGDVELPFIELKEFLRRSCLSILKAEAKKMGEDTNKYISRQEFPWTQDIGVFKVVAEKPQKRALEEVSKTTATLVAAIAEGDGMDDDSVASAARSNAAADLFGAAAGKGGGDTQEAFSQAILSAHADKALNLNLSDINAQHLLDALIPYGQIASKRFIDEVPIIAWDHYHSLPRLLLRELLKVQEEDFRYAMQDTPEMERARTRRRMEIAEMEEVLRSFDDLHFSY